MFLDALPQTFEFDFGSESALQTAFELSSEALVFLDAELGVVGFNPAFQSLTGEERPALIGRVLAELEVFADGGGLREALDELLERGSCRAELIFGGTLHPRRIVALRFSTLPGVASEVTGEASAEVRHVGVLRDLTELRRLESVSLAVNLTENLGQVFSGIRHELGNPINSVKTAFSVLRRSYDDLSVERRELYFENIGRELTRVEDLLKSLRNFSAFERPTSEPFSVDAFLSRIELMTASDFERRGIRLVVEKGSGDGHEEIEVTANRRALLQVFLNLLNNALDAIQDVDEPTISIGVHRARNRVLFRVADNGVGFRREDAARLLEPFYTTKEQGSGLGLAICHKLVVAMHGSMYLNGAPGKGCIVTLSLPGGGEPVASAS